MLASVDCLQLFKMSFFWCVAWWVIVGVQDILSITLGDLASYLNHHPVLILYVGSGDFQMTELPTIVKRSEHLWYSLGCLVRLVSMELTWVLLEPWGVKCLSYIPVASVKYSRKKGFVWVTFEGFSPSWWGRQGSRNSRLHLVSHITSSAKKKSVMNACVKLSFFFIQARIPSQWIVLLTVMSLPISA